MEKVKQKSPRFHIKILKHHGTNWLMFTTRVSFEGQHFRSIFFKPRYGVAVPGTGGGRAAPIPPPAGRNFGKLLGKMFLTMDQNKKKVLYKDNTTTQANIWTCDA